MMRNLPVICKIIHYPCTFLDFRPCFFYRPSHFFCHSPCNLFLVLSKFVSKIVNMISSFLYICFPLRIGLLSFLCFSYIYSLVIISYVSMTSFVAGFIVENSLVIIEFAPFMDLLYPCLVFCLLLALLILL